MNIRLYHNIMYETIKIHIFILKFLLYYYSNIEYSTYLEISRQHKTVKIKRILTVTFSYNDIMFFENHPR